MDESEKKKRGIKVLIWIAIAVIFIILLFPHRTDNKNGITKISNFFVAYTHWDAKDDASYDVYRNNPKYSPYLKDGRWQKESICFLPLFFPKGTLSIDLK